MKKILVCILTVAVLLSFVLGGCTREINNSQEDDTILEGSGQSKISEISGDNKSTENDKGSKLVESNKLWIFEFSDLRQVMLVREGKSLKDLDLTNEYDTLLKTTFDTRTEWPSKDKLPKEFNPQEIIEIGKNPGLGIKSLHSQGITGQGVNVAIIDQPLLLGHEEYKDKVVKYTAIECEDVGPQMHGPAVASILVGRDCGVAPDASLYYWAEPYWKGDYIYRTTALDHIIEHNKNKPLNERIRVVSVSKGFDQMRITYQCGRRKLKKLRKVVL